MNVRIAIRQASKTQKYSSMTKHCAMVCCVTLYSLACSVSNPVGAQAQSPETTLPQFEVTSVRQNTSQSESSAINSELPDRFVATNVPLRFLLLDAFEIRDHELVGAPEWTSEKSFDIVGAYPEARRPSAHEIHLMLEQVLADRFGLRVHREQRELPAYDLVLARKDGRLGPQIHKSDMNCAAWIADGRPKTAAGPPSPVSPAGERPTCSLIATRKWLTGGARTMQDLAASLQSMLGRPVVDKTGLAGAYDIDLQWAAMDLHADEAANATSTEGPSLFSALDDQLGLRLVSHKETFEVVVVDAIHQPSPN